jgi:SulP family sulfate permease
MPAYLTKFLPFLRWFPMKGDMLRADFMAGITVALVLIPQSMAYAQLAGLPAYYGLYAAFSRSPLPRCSAARISLAPDRWPWCRC